MSNEGGRRELVLFFKPIPVVVPPGLSDDDKLLAAWAGLPDPEPTGTTATVRAARRRVVELRRERGVTS